MRRIRSPILALAVALATWMALAAAPSHAGVTYLVTKTADTNDGLCDTDCSLREALVAANANSGADIITLPSGTYTLTIPGAGEEFAATADLDITDHLSINGAGAGSSIIDGNGGALNDRVIQVTGPFVVMLSGVSIRNGNTAGDGGGIYSLGNLGINSSTVSSNNSVGGGGGGGGGIYSRGNLDVNSSTVSSNNSAGGGGGIYSTGIVNMNSSTVSGNTAFGGGGIFNTVGTGGTLRLTSSTVSGNSANFGGGIVNNGGTADVTSSTVSGNAAAIDGGGIHNLPGTFKLTSSTVSGNTAANNGGGILNQVGTATLTSSTVSANSAGSSGGGMWNKDGTTTLTSSTVSANSAGSSGGGMWNNLGTATLNNSIVAGSPLGGNCAGPATSNGYNLSSDGTCTFNKLSDLNNTNPLLGPLAYNGGPTQTHALLQGSPALNNGDHACPPPATDQRGVSRPQGPRCDIGAFEAVDTDSDATPDAFDDNDDNDGLVDGSDPCPLAAEDYDGFQDSDGCPETDNDLDGICDAGQTSVSCTGSDFGKTAFYPTVPAAHPHGDPAPIDCRNLPEDYDAFKDSDGCPEPDNDNDGKPDGIDVCPGTGDVAGADGVLGSSEDDNHNGRLDPGEDVVLDGVLTTDDGVLTFEDYDGILDNEGCHDSPGDDRDGDGFSDEAEVLFIGTDAAKNCGSTGWPADLAGNNNILNIGDFNSFLFPLRIDGSFAKFGHAVPDPMDANIGRWNLDPNATINIGDLNALNPGVDAPTARPPMFGGQAAFFTNGGQCPFPP